MLRALSIPGMRLKLGLSFVQQLFGSSQVPRRSGDWKIDNRIRSIEETRSPMQFASGQTLRKQNIDEPQRLSGRRPFPSTGSTSTT